VSRCLLVPTFTTTSPPPLPLPPSDGFLAATIPFAAPLHLRYGWLHSNYSLIRWTKPNGLVNASLHVVVTCTLPILSICLLQSTPSQFLSQTIYSLAAWYWHWRTNIPTLWMLHFARSTYAPFRRRREVAILANNATVYVILHCLSNFKQGVNTTEFIYVGQTDMEATAGTALYPLHRCKTIYLVLRTLPPLWVTDL
jgi:hypothetical protein